MSAVKRKKFAVPPARSACLMCRAARVRCSGDSPCARCRKKNQTCTFKPSRRGLRGRSPSPNILDAPDPLDMAVDDSSVIISGAAISVEQPYNQLDNMVDAGFLPTLYTDDLDAFRFDQMFTGDSDEALDRFFADIFCLPSFPRAEGLDTTLLLTDYLTPPCSALQEYRSDADVLRAYYQLVHPVFPILPPPSESSTDSTENQPDAVYEPSSPLILSLLSILVSGKEQDSTAGLPPGTPPRIRLANSFAQCAAEACEISSETRNTGSPSFIRSSAHPSVPIELEVPLAFCVLSLFQYLYCGNIKEMTRFAEKAIDSAIRLSLHKQERKDGDLIAEAKSRAWWMTYLCMCHASTVSCKPPLRSINLADVQTPFPTSSYRPRVWDRYIRAEETLVAATLLLVALVKGFHSEAAIPSFRQSLEVLNNLINSQLTQLNEVTAGVTALSDIPESRLADCLHNITRMRLMSAHIKTHRYRALMEYPVILEKFEAYPPLDVSDRPPSGRNASEFHGPDRVNGIFPFTSLESLQVCFESALGIAGCLNSLSDDLPVAPFSCSAIIAGYTALMILHFHISGTGRTWPRLTVDELGERCKATVITTLRALENYSAGFPFVHTLAGKLLL
ncbi:hypothetical protein FALCPG4_007660 [Fusarium falciforme]